MTPGFDPQLLPVISVDAHLPAVPALRLQPEALRARFREPPAWQPEIVAERRIGTPREPAHASVLVPLVMREGGLTVLLTQRSDHLTDHPGQVSFPGGRAEAFDADATATALREAQEEIGLAAAHVEVLGSLPIYTTGTGFIVTPVVALVSDGFELNADPFEVADVFEVPLAFLMTPAHHRRHEVRVGGGEPRQFLSMPWPSEQAGSGTPRRFVWGATAAMLRNLYGFLSA